MSEEPRVPSHMRRARFTRRTQILLAVVAALFTLYRLAAGFRRRGLR